jgi:hypothetical protein
VSAADASGIAAQTTAQLLTVTAPPTAEAVLRSWLTPPTSGTSTCDLLLTATDQTDVAPTQATATIHAERNASYGDTTATQLRVRTNAASQVRWRASTGSGHLSVATLGWIDSRGRDA